VRAIDPAARRGLGRLRRSVGGSLARPAVKVNEANISRARWLPQLPPSVVAAIRDGRQPEVSAPPGLIVGEAVERRGQQPRVHATTTII